jgi:hypothetical protein
MVDKAQTIEHQGFERFPDGTVAHVWVLLRRVVHDFANATFVQHPRDKAKMSHDLTTIGLCHVISSPEEILPTPQFAQIPSRLCGMAVLWLDLVIETYF